MLSRDLGELDTKMVPFASTIRLMLDDSSREEGTCFRERDHELDLFVEITANEAVGNVDADTRLAHVAGLEHIEPTATHDLDFDRRQAARDDTRVGSNRIQKGGGGEASHHYSIGIAPGELEPVAGLHPVDVEVADSLPTPASYWAG